MDVDALRAAAQEQLERDPEDPDALAIVAHLDGLAAASDPEQAELHGAALQAILERLGGGIRAILERTQDVIVVAEQEGRRRSFGGEDLEGQA